MKLKRLLIVFAVFSVSSAWACSAVLVGKKASATGHVLVGHNEDGSGMIRHALLPRRNGAPEIFWSEVKHAQGRDAVSHLFYNEYGVIVGSNNGGVMKSWDGVAYDLPDEGAYSSLSDGGIGYDLRIRMISCAHTAREGVEKMAELIERYGYTQMSRNFFIADRDEAWVFMALKGRRYVARRVPDDVVVAYPNCLIFNRLQPGDLASKSIREKGTDFDVIAGYQGPRTWKSPYNLHRWRNLYRIVAGVELEAGSEYPFGVRPAHPVSVQDIKNGLCSHYEGRPDEVKDRHPAKNPKTIEPICRLSTLEAFVGEMGCTPGETRLHMTVGRPCEVPYGVYQPFAGVFPADTVFGDRAIERMDRNQDPVVDRVRTAVFVGTGIRSNGCSEWIRLIGSAPELECVFVDEATIAAGALNGCEVLVVPGGDSRTVRKHLGSAGAAAIRKFVRAGGGYFGTCAGCCLALDEKAEPLRGIGLIPYRRIGSKGHAMTPIQFNELGAGMLGIKPEAREVRYSRGPVMERVQCDDPEVRIDSWGIYVGDMVHPRADFAMTGNVAVVGGTYGKGRVFAIASHPESFTWTRDIVRGGLSFVAGRKVTLAMARPRTMRALTVGYFTPTMAGVTSAQMILRLDAARGIDLFPLDSDWIHFNMLDHVDAVILPDGSEQQYRRYGKLLSEGLTAFQARGGTVYGWGVGAAFVPMGGVVCDSPAKILEVLGQ